MKLSAPLFVAALLVLGLSEASALPVVLDQEHESSNTSFCAVGCEWQQGIVAGLTGGLAEVDFEVALFSADGTVAVEIFLGQPWQGGAALYSTTVSMIGSGWHTAVLPTPIFMTAGTEFTMSVLGLSGAFVFLGGSAPGGGPYAPGISGLNGSAPYADGNFDLNFRSLVDLGVQGEPAPVPEPASLLLMGLGLAGVASRVRARRRK